jgi:PAS domain S-box-containing protein
MASPLRILHLEDNPNDAELVRETLAENELPCTITRVETGEAFKAALEGERFDLILSDYNLPTFNGMEALKLATAIRPHIPFVFVSGVMGEEFAVLTLQLGATDYVLKKNLARLPTAVRRALNEAEATATRMRMEESLRLHAMRMKSIMETSLDAVVVMDNQGMILDWNAQATSVFDWQKSDVLGRTVVETIIPFQHREAHTRGLARFLATGEGPVLNRRIEITALHRTGREFPVELAITPTKINDHWQFTAFIRDLTERKQAEEALRERVRLATLSVEVSLALNRDEPIDELLRICVEAVERHLDAALARIWTIAPGDLCGECHKASACNNRTECLHLSASVGLSTNLNGEYRRVPLGALKIGRIAQGWGAISTNDVLGDERLPNKEWLRMNGLQSFAGFPLVVGGKVYGVMAMFAKVPLSRSTLETLESVCNGVAATISRKEAERALRDSEQRYKLLVDHANDIIYRTDGEGRFIFVNPTATRLTQYSERELLGMRFSDLIRPDHRRITERFYDRQFLSKTPNTYHEFPAIRKDGIEVWLGQNVQQLFENGQLVGFQAVARDVTERRQLEESRLAKLSAERANQAKNEFLSRMSHELRTPLNAVLGFAQLLEMEALSPEQQQHVQHILKGGRHLLALINEVLDISRIEAGRLTLSLEPVSVSAVVGEAVDLVRPQAAARDIRLVVQSPWKETIYVRADRQRLKQALLNLLSNGVKYNREGGALTVSCEAVPEGRYRVAVADTGGGIPAAMMSRLFTPFDRLEADARIEGTGLGLVLSRSLITAMGGTIFVDSVVGQGTTVSIELPLSEPPATGDSSMPARIQVAAPVRGLDFTILYIEDNPPNYQLVEHLVEKRPGVRLVGAMQGKLGVELAVSHRPDLILLDLNLPDIQGDEVLLRLRECPETAGIPVVMLSADAMPRQIDRLLAAGARGYLTKPIEVAQFYALLDKFITKKGG